MKNAQENLLSAARVLDIERLQARAMPPHETLIIPAIKTRVAPGSATANRRQLSRHPKPLAVMILGRSGENEILETAGSTIFIRSTTTTAPGLPGEDYLSRKRHLSPEKQRQNIVQFAVDGGVHTCPLSVCRLGCPLSVSARSAPSPAAIWQIRRAAAHRRTKSPAARRICAAAMRAGWLRFRRLRRPQSSQSGAQDR